MIQLQFFILNLFVKFSEGLADLLDSVEINMKLQWILQVMSLSERVENHGNRPSVIALLTKNCWHRRGILKSVLSRF